MDAERCVSCGAIIPEGRQVCLDCECVGKMIEKRGKQIESDISMDFIKRKLKEKARKQDLSGVMKDVKEHPIKICMTSSLEDEEENIWKRGGIDTRRRYMKWVMALLPELFFSGLSVACYLGQKEYTVFPVIAGMLYLFPLDKIYRRIYKTIHITPEWRWHQVMMYESYFSNDPIRYWRCINNTLYFLTKTGERRQCRFQNKSMREGITILDISMDELILPFLPETFIAEIDPEFARLMREC